MGAGKIKELHMGVYFIKKYIVSEGRRKKNLPSLLFLGKLYL